jgi:WD40 repeat protein
MKESSGNTPELYRTLQGHNDGIQCLTFNSNSKQLASVSADHSLYLWNLQAKNIQAKKLKGHSGAITEVAFSPSGALIATASMDNTVRVWSNNAIDNYPSQVIRSHNACVKSVAFSPDSRFIVSASDDKSIKIFNVSSGLSTSPRPRSSSSRC